MAILDRCSSVIAVGELAELEALAFKAGIDLVRTSLDELDDFGKRRSCRATGMDGVHESSAASPLRMVSWGPVAFVTAMSSDGILLKELMSLRSKDVFLGRD